MILSKNQLKGLTNLTLINALLIQSKKEEQDLLEQLEIDGGSKKKEKQLKEILAIRNKAINSIWRYQQLLSKKFPRKWNTIQKKRVKEYSKLFAQSFNLLPLHLRRLGLKEKEIFTELDYVVKAILDLNKQYFDYNPIQELEYYLTQLLNHPLSHYHNMDEKHKEAVKMTINSYFLKINKL